MTVLLLQPSPTEKLLNNSMFSTVRWIRYLRRLDRGGNRSTLKGQRAQQGGMGTQENFNNLFPKSLPARDGNQNKAQQDFMELKSPNPIPDVQPDTSHT